VESFDADLLRPRNQSIHPLDPFLNLRQRVKRLQRQPPAKKEISQNGALTINKYPTQPESLASAGNHRLTVRYRASFSSSPSRRKSL